eukprot:641241-Alexandrium_andersonii.AAC.1
MYSVLHCARALLARARAGGSAIPLPVWALLRRVRIRWAGGVRRGRRGRFVGGAAALLALCPPGSAGQCVCVLPCSAPATP